MGLLLFEDDDLEVLYEVVNKLQICFHHTYAPNGYFSVESIFELQKNDKNVIIIADRNIVSPICEIAVNGKMKDEKRMRKIALFVTWSKYINAQLSSGLGLYESDTSGLNTTSGEENRLQFLHGVDTIPSQLWKMLAFGEIDEIPKLYLYKNERTSNVKYDFSDNLLYLCNQTAILKISQLIRTIDIVGVDKFLLFMEWYSKHMDVAESMIVYAACVFMDVKHASKPKGSGSGNFKRAMAGIMNQAWDLTYITAWSMFYRNESENDITMFATDDITQKIIAVNILPPGESGNALHAIFTEAKDYKRVSEFFMKNFGKSRIRPFSSKTTDDNIADIKKILGEEKEKFEKMF